MTATKARLLEAAENHFLEKGYTATTVDEICKAAGTTKGAFFHHFDNKLGVALEAVELHAGRRFEAFRRRVDPDAISARGRVLTYIDGMVALAAQSERPACLVTAMTLELADVQPEVRARVKRAFDGWSEDLARMLADACPPDGPSPESLAHQIMATFQGAMVVARAKGDREVLPQVMGNLRDYVASVLVDTEDHAAA